MMWPVWQMMLPWPFSGHLREGWVWPWGGQLATWWPRLPVTAFLMSFSTRHLQDSWVGALYIITRIGDVSSIISSFLLYGCFPLRYKAYRGHRKQVAGHLLSGGGARLPGERGGQCPTQWQDPVHLRQVHAGDDPGGCGQSLRDRPS